MTERSSPDIAEALMAAQRALASCRHLIRKYVPAHDWFPSIDEDIEAVKAARAALPAAPAGGERSKAIEECAKIVDAEALFYEGERKRLASLHTSADSPYRDELCSASAKRSTLENSAALIRALATPSPIAQSSEGESGAATPSDPVAWQFRQRSAVGKGPQSQLPWCDWICIGRDDYDLYVRHPNPLVQVRPLYADLAQGSGYPAEEYAKVALGNAVEIGRLEILVARMERAVKAASVYYGCYVQDEAEEVECCISSEHHEAAKELRDALREAVSALPSTTRETTK
jgi:hypothetical protein